MRRLLTVASLLLCFISYTTDSLFAAAYEASTLHNAVARSENVQSLFVDRWSLIQENNWNLDFFGRINWVPDFQVYDVDASGDKTAVNMRLIRTYGGFTYLHNFGKEKTGGGMLEPGRIRAGFTTIGYHYGLTRSVEIDRGSAGNDTVTDYKYTQFFDDIFAASFIWEPYGYFHGGIIVNNQIKPNDDGTMSYFNSTRLKARYFINFNILFFLDSNMIFDNGSIDTMEIQVNANMLYGFFAGPLHPLVPETTVGFKMIGAYNDEPYDAVWVNQTIDDPLYKKESAHLFLYSLGLKEKLFNRLYLETYLEFQSHSGTLIDKRTEEKLSFSPVRTFSCSLGYDFFHEYPRSQLIPKIGYSSFWDPAVAVHGESVRYRAQGMFFSLYFQSLIMGNDISAEFRTSYNDAAQLNKLVETVDKVNLELQLTYSFNSSTVFRDTGDPFDTKEELARGETKEETPKNTEGNVKEPAEIQP